MNETELLTEEEIERANELIKRQNKVARLRLKWADIVVKELHQKVHRKTHGEILYFVHNGLCISYDTYHPNTNVQWAGRIVLNEHSGRITNYHPGKWEYLLSLLYAPLREKMDREKFLKRIAEDQANLQKWGLTLLDIRAPGFMIPISDDFSPDELFEFCEIYRSQIKDQLKQIDALREFAIFVSDINENTPIPLTTINEVRRAAIQVLEQTKRSLD